MNIRQLSIGFILLLLPIVVIACAGGSGATTTTSASAAAPKYSVEVARGAELFVNYACVQCHGLGGGGRELIPTSGPSLASSEFKKAFPRKPEVDDTLVQVIKNGAIIESEGRVASMPAWNGILSDDDIANVVAYIRAGLPDLQVPISRGGTGEDAYKAFACIQCHGEVGKGGKVNQAAIKTEDRNIPTLGGDSFRKRLGSKDEVRNVIIHGRLVEGGRPGVVYMPAWGRIGTADQVDQLVNYLWTYGGQ